LISRLIAVTRQLGHSQTGLTMFVKEAHEIAAGDKVKPAWLERLRGDLIGLSRHCGAETKNLARLGDLQDDSLSISRIGREFYFTAAKDVDPPGVRTFMKDH